MGGGKVSVVRDRETLAAALAELKFEGSSNRTTELLKVVFAAAHERLAQLPEKCEHGEMLAHKVKIQGDREVPSRYVLCSGGSYPPALVERIAGIIVEIGHPNDRAVAVLDALKETA